MITFNSIIFMTDYFAKMHGFNAPEEIKGKKIADIPNAQKHLNLVAKLEYIRQMVIENQMPVSYIVCGKLNDEFYANDVKHAPLFHPDGTVIATIVIGGDYHWFSRSEFALSHFKHVTKIPQDKQLELQKKINLTVRQHEILFLLLCGFSQQESVELLNIARGNLAKTLDQYIFPKFGIHGSRLSTLLERAYSMGFQNLVPKSMHIPRIIIHDERFKLKK